VTRVEAGEEASGRKRFGNCEREPFSIGRAGGMKPGPSTGRKRFGNRKSEPFSPARLPGCFLQFESLKRRDEGFRTGRRPAARRTTGKVYRGPTPTPRPHAPRHLRTPVSRSDARGSRRKTSHHLGASARRTRCHNPPAASETSGNEGSSASNQGLAPVPQGRPELRLVESAT
jgi:hypothetical protein